MQIRVFIADDHALMREALRRLLDISNVVVVGEADNGTDTLRQLDRLDVDLLLLDMCMPGCRGEELVARIHGCHPQLPILVVSMYGEAWVARAALLAGATGYVAKGSEPSVLLTAVGETAHGRRFVDTAVGGNDLAANSPPSGEWPLAHREFQILRMIAGGMRLNDIAARLGISDKTVSSHKRRLMAKMGFTSDADIIKFALTRGLAQ